MNEKRCSIVFNGSDPLKETELANIQHAIESHLPKFEGVYQIERIEGNQSPTARVFKLTGGPDVFVVRILDREKYLEESTNEIRLMRSMSEQRVTPPVYHADESTGIIIMKFIKDVPVFRDKSERAQDALIDLANKIKLMHKLPLRAKPTSLLPSNLQKERLHEVYKRAALHEAFQIYLQGAEYLNQLSIFIQPEGFCHNNLHKYNVLHSGEQCHIIDWETAGAGDPFLDLANFVALARFSNEQITLFLTAYLGHKPSEMEFSRFQIMKQISYLRYALGQFAAIKLEQVTLDTLDFDKIPLLTDPSYVRSISTPQDQFIFSFSILKEALSTISSPVFIDAIRLQTTKHGFLASSLGRLFTFSNPKTIKRAELAVQPHLKEKSSQPTIESLSGGSEQATNYKVQMNNNFVALRVYGDDTTTQKFQRDVTLYQQAATIGIGPDVMIVDDELLCLATSFVITVPTGWQRTLTSSQLTQLAEQMKKLHGNKFVIETPELTPTGLPLTSLKKAQNLATDFSLSSLKEIISIYNRLLSLLKPEVLSHNSLSRDNILFDGENFQFIDWENATFNDRLYDPAFLSCYFFLTPDQEKTLLTAYLGHKITPEEGFVS